MVGDVPIPAGWSKYCKGIFTGGCVERGKGSSFWAKAHAHCGPEDPNIGWICVRAARRVLTPSGKPSTLLYHEYAHLIVGYDAAHGPEWRKVVTELGFPAEAAEYLNRGE
jgi:hypothetical protein